MPKPPSSRSNSSLRWPAGAELPIDLLELAVKAARSLQSAQGLGARVQALRIDNVLGRQRIDLPTALALMETGPREAFVSSEVTEKVRTQLQLLPCSFDFLALSERLAASDDTLDARAKEARAPLVSWVREQAALRIPQAPTERSNPRP